MIKELDLNANLQTTSGRKVEYITTVYRADGSTFNILCVTMFGDEKYPFFINKIGWTEQDFGFSVIEEQKIHDVWANFYKNEGTFSFKDKESADSYDKSCPEYYKRISCINVKFKEGDGL